MLIRPVKQLILAGLMIAFGLLLPMISHAFGAGPALLPMHIPVIAAGFILDLPFAVAVGAITPLLSSLTTGMPPLFPVAVIMVFELAAYAAVSNITYRKFRLNVYLSIITTMIAGRVVAGATVWILAALLARGLPGPVEFVSGAIVAGIPGIAVQLFILPVLIMVLVRNRLIMR